MDALAAGPGGGAAPAERPALLRASSALRWALSGHCIASREAGEGAGVCMELEGRSFCNSEVRILSPQPTSAVSALLFPGVKELSLHFATYFTTPIVELHVQQTSKNR